MTPFKLFYFNARGVGELARLIFVLANVEYEDKRITTGEAWPKLTSVVPFDVITGIKGKSAPEPWKLYIDGKKKEECKKTCVLVTSDRLNRIIQQLDIAKMPMSLKCLPVLEVDGKRFCQSGAIARYLAGEFGLMGGDKLDALRIGEIQEIDSELMSKDVSKIIAEKDEERKREIVKTFKETALPKYQDFLEMRLREKNDGNGFLLDKISLGDLIIYNMHTILESLEVDPFKDRPLLKAHFDRVGNEPQIAAWVNIRPVTKF